MECRQFAGPVFTTLRLALGLAAVYGRRPDSSLKGRMVVEEEDIECEFTNGLSITDLLSLSLTGRAIRLAFAYSIYRIEAKIR